MARSVTLPRFSPTVGSYAGVVLASLLSFLGAGIIWALLRPAYTATVVEQGTQIELGTEANVEFTAYGLFVIASFVIGCAVAVMAYVRAPHTRSLWMLLWVGLWVFLGAQLFIYAGEWVSRLVNDVSEAGSLADGESVSYVPAFTPGIVAHAVAPFWAVLVYWCCIVVGSDAEEMYTGPDNDTEREENTSVAPS